MSSSELSASFVAQGFRGTPPDFCSSEDDSREIFRDSHPFVKTNGNCAAETGEDPDGRFGCACPIEVKYT